jgi:tripeptidyl-peptidase-2
MDVTIRDGRKSSDTGTSASTRLYVLHTVQLIPHAAYRDYAQQKYLNLLPSQTSVTSIAVEAGVTCEIDIGRYWSSAGITKADVSVEFRGIQPVPAVLSMNSGDCFGLVQIHSFVKDETINPSAKLNKWKTPLRPKAEGVITPLGERDVQPWSEKKTYQLVLTYEFTMDEKGVFTPRAPPLQDVLYESIYESQIMLAYDGDKKYLGYCDAYAHSITAPKGTVVIKMQVRHDDPAMLDKLKDMTIWIERKLDKEVPLSAYATREDLLIGGNKRSIRKRTLRKGMGASVFFSEPASSSKLPSSCKAGDILMGTAYYASGEASLPGDGKRPGGFPISYTLGPKMENKPAASEAEVAEPKDERTPEQRLSEAIRDLKVDLLGKLTSAEKDSGKFEEIYAELWKEYPSHVPLLMTNLKCLDGLKKRSEILPQIEEAADKVIAQISEDELALHFGKKLDKDDPEKVKRNKELEKKKSHLIEALVRQAHAFCEMKTDEAPSKFDKTLDKLKAWVDIDSNGKYAALAIERDCRASRYGLALKRINKLLTKNGKDSGGIKPLTKADLFEKRCEIFKQLGYDALVKRDQAMRLVAAPNDYKLF